MSIIGVLCFCIVCFGFISGKFDVTLTSKDKLVLQDFKIGGLYLEQPISEAIKILGEPIKVKSIPNKDGLSEYDEEDYYFNGVTIRVEKSNKKVIQVRIERKDLRTYRGIRVGDKEENVYKHYGKTVKSDDILFYQAIAYQKSIKEAFNKSINVYYIISFSIKKGVVSKIGLDYAPEE